MHDLENVIQDIDDYTSKNVAETYEINLSSNVELNVEPSSTTSNEPLDKYKDNTTTKNPKDFMSVLNEIQFENLQNI